MIYIWSYSFYKTAQKYHTKFAHETYPQLKERLKHIYPFLSNVSDNEFKDRCTTVFSMKAYLNNDPSKTDILINFNKCLLFQKGLEGGQILTLFF